jgi:hypothetical protein
MRETAPDKLEPYRLLDGPLESPAGALWGAFRITTDEGNTLTVMSSNGEDWPYEEPAWEHVSVSCRNRTPTWEEMALIKSLFWEPEEAVVQFHPPASRYINVHQFCLHLWRPIGIDIPLPPTSTIG